MKVKFNNGLTIKVKEKSQQKKSQMPQISHSNTIYDRRISQMLAKSFKSLGTGRNLKQVQLIRCYEKLLFQRETMMKEYNSLLKMYETNEWKLQKIIQNELNTKDYLYSKQFPEFSTIKSLKLDLFENNLRKVTTFLTEFNIRKRMKQVDIIKESMINRQKMIRQSADNHQYRQIYKKMRQPVKVNPGFTIYDQLKGILQSHNANADKNRIHQQLFRKISDAQETVYEIVRDIAEEKEKKSIFY